MQTLWQSSVFQRFWQVAGAASVRVKVLGIVLGVILLLSLFITLQMRAALTETLKIELQNQGVAISEHVARQASVFLADADLPTLQVFFAERQAHFSGGGHNTRVSYIVLYNAEGEVIEHTFDGSVPTVLQEQVNAQESTSGFRHIMTEQERVLDIATPLPYRQGVLHLGLAESTIEETVNAVTWQIVSITLVMVVVGLLAAFFLTWILTRPILSLVEATQAVAKGDFTRRVPRWANDEIGDLAEAFNAMTEALAQADREQAEREALRANYIHGVIHAQEEERKRIARELHDSTSQSLTSLLVGLRNLEETREPAMLGSHIEEIRHVVSRALDEVHALAWQLRPSVLDDLGLCVALQRYVADFQRRYSIQVDFVERGLDGRLPQELETSIYRVVQEGLTNIARHSQARNASVLIERRKKVLRVIVEDNGIGFDPALIKYGEHSLGLQGIRERAQLFGGKLTIEAQPGQGSSLFVEIPMIESRHNG